jgi:Tfp pilus assembly protein FimT
MKRKRRGSTLGYTTVELIMAMLVGTILTAMAIPQGKSIVNNYRLQGAVANCTWAIQSTRYQALEQGYPYRVVFSASARTYQIQNLPTGASTYANVGSAVPLSGETATLNQDTTLQFKPNGSVTATTGSLTFQVSYQGLTRTVTVSTYGDITLS